MAIDANHVREIVARYRRGHRGPLQCEEPILISVAEAWLAGPEQPALTIEQVIAACAGAYGTSLGEGITVYEAADGCREGGSAMIHVALVHNVDGRMVSYGDNAEAAIQQLGRDAIEIIRKRRDEADAALRACGVTA